MMTRLQERMVDGLWQTSIHYQKGEGAGEGTTREI